MVKKRKRPGRWLATCMSVLLAGSLCTGCALLPEEGDVQQAPILETEEPYEYEMDVVIRESIYRTVLLYPKYQEIGGAQLAFGKSGYVSEVKVTQGEAVHAGDVLAEQDGVAELRERAESLQEQIDADQKNYDKQSTLRGFDEQELSLKLTLREINQEAYDKGMEAIAEKYDLPMQELEDRLYLQRLELEQMLEEIEEGCLISPIDGNVAYLDKNIIGRWAQADKMVIQVVDTSEQVFVLETEYAPYFKVGDVHTLRNASNSLIYDTVVSSVEGEKVIFTLLDEGVTLALNLTMRCFLELESRENVLTIQASSVRYNADKAFVYYIDADGVRGMKEVVVGMRGGEKGTSSQRRIEIISGLSLGDIVINK